MTELDKLIEAAFNSEGKQDIINKFYLTLSQTPLYIPTQKDPAGTEPFYPLFTNIQDKHYLLAFDSLLKLQNWAGELHSKIEYVVLSGMDLIAGIEPSVYLCFNLGTPLYKEFSPDEILHLKKIFAKIYALTHPVN